jgi:hypothetical protein
MTGERGPKGTPGTKGNDGWPGLPGLLLHKMKSYFLPLFFKDFKDLKDSLE